VRSFKAVGEWSFKATILAKEEETVSRGNDGACHTRFLHQNQVLICMTQDQLFHTYG
jgi:hypothetical protein